MNEEWWNRYEIAQEAVQNAGQAALRYFDQDVSVEWKQDNTPVTIADRTAEQVFRETVREAFPEDGFLGEEFGNEPSQSGYRWIIDPIDGTRSFIRNIPLWGTLVGLEYHGEMIAGFAFAPALGQTWHALKGMGTYRNDRKIQVSSVSELKGSILSYTDIGLFEPIGKTPAFEEVRKAVDRSRGYSDFYGMVLVAQGSCEVMLDYGTKIWDVAGLIVIVEEAGGKFSNWDGQRDPHRPDVLFTNNRVHSEVLALLNG
ncbi:MAG: histidinol phosphate phosphatase [Gemmataceae bacterium]|jgi:histidinol-phosphatase|nr:histidinol phosphate phosphatase [Gemmataceae bacterium]